MKEEKKPNGMETNFGMMLPFWCFMYVHSYRRTYAHFGLVVILHLWQTYEYIFGYSNSNASGRSEKRCASQYEACALHSSRMLL